MGVVRRAAKYSSASISRWRSRQVSITPTVVLASTTDGCANSPSPRKSARAAKFFSRPVLRAFVTYANWSDGFRGLVGGVPYANRTNGLSVRGADRDLVVRYLLPHLCLCRSQDRIHFIAGRHGWLRACARNRNGGRSGCKPCTLRRGASPG